MFQPGKGNLIVIFEQLICFLGKAIGSFHPLGRGSETLNHKAAQKSHERQGGSTSDGMNL